MGASISHDMEVPGLSQGSELDRPSDNEADGKLRNLYYQSGSATTISFRMLWRATILTRREGRGGGRGGEWGDNSRRWQNGQFEAEKVLRSSLKRGADEMWKYLHFNLTSSNVRLPSLLSNKLTVCNNNNHYGAALRTSKTPKINRMNSILVALWPSRGTMSALNLSGEDEEVQRVVQLSYYKCDKPAAVVRLKS